MIYDIVFDSYREYRLGSQILGLLNFIGSITCWWCAWRIVTPRSRKNTTVRLPFTTLWLHEGCSCMNIITKSRVASGGLVLGVVLSVENFIDVCQDKSKVQRGKHIEI